MYCSNFSCARASAIALAIALGAALTACERPAVTSSPATQTEWPQVDRSTPDNALRSYWATRDAVRKHMEQAIAEDAPKWSALRLTLEITATNPIAKTFVDGEGSRVFETFSRDILEVKVESDSRALAIALIKNTTPIPNGAEMRGYDEERRRDGERYKYVLQKNADGWRVDEIWKWDTFPSPNWRKVHPGEGKPSVPSLTYEGV